ncbi:hypothetical protein HK105_202658 [Polyrhizophydium stewartii]|uniref:Transmembrane protein n=1 Tax=Polyrhizophydium stewartii TaxID=2732419 RepID=A0ABR4NE41_9FUNG
MVMAAAAAVFAVYVLALGLPRKVAVGSTWVSQDEVDATLAPRAFLLVVVLLAGIAGVACVGVFYIAMPVYAIKPSE